MRFSTKAGYGLRAIVNLANCYPRQKNLNIIAKEEGISEKYLEQLFRVLKKNKIVKSHKGREGGYVLAGEPKKFTAGQIIEALEGPIMPMQCADGKCDIKCSCASSIVWTKLQTQIKKTLYSIKLNELIK